MTKTVLGGGSSLVLEWPRISVVALLVLLVVSLGEAAVPARLSYDVIYPEYRPWTSCTPIDQHYEACFYFGTNDVIFLQGSNRCEYDTRNYLVGNPYFSFPLQMTRNATIVLYMYRCYERPEYINVSVNGRCISRINNPGYHDRNLEPYYVSAPIEGSCFNVGENRITIEGSVQLSMGAGECPRLSCLNAPLYADITFQENSERTENLGTMSTGQTSTHYSFGVVVPDGANGRFELPPGVMNVECGAGCAVTSNLVSFGAGNRTIAYDANNLNVTVSFDNEYAAYFSNESIVAYVETSFGGTPVSSEIYYSNGSFACNASSGACEVEFSDRRIGRHLLELEAIENLAGRRGVASVEYSVEHDADVRVSEAFSGGRLVVLHEILNPTHEEFERTLNYSLPEEYAGNLRIDPEPEWWIASNRTVSFLARCPLYSNCTYDVSFLVTGTVAVIGEPVFPERALVGEPVIGTGTVFLANGNSARSLRSQGSIGGGCSGGCSWDLILLPLEDRTLEYRASREGATECGIQSSNYQNETQLFVCINVPAGFPNQTELAYLVPIASIPDYGGNPAATLGGKALNVSAGANGLTVYLGKLTAGNHYVSVRMRRTDSSIVRRDEKKNQVTEPETKKTETLDREGSDETEPADAVAAIWSPDACDFGEVLQVTVTVGEEPGKGNVRFVSPSGREFAVQVSGGRASQVMDENGVWRVYFGDSEKTVLVGKEDRMVVAEQTSVKSQAKKGSSPIYASGTNPLIDLWPWALLALLPLIATPVLGYALLVASRGPTLLIQKKYDGMNVFLEIENRGASVTDVRLTDMLPDDAVLGETNGGSFKKTIFGNVVKWRLPALGNNETWRVRYGMATGSSEVGEAKLCALDSRGNSVSASSGRVTIFKGAADNAS